jgi:hypothetical protein
MRARVRSRDVTVLLSLLACAQVQAQWPTELSAGDRVRISVRTRIGPRSVTGLLLLLDRDSITIVPRRSAPVSFALYRLQRFELNRGRSWVLVYGSPVVGAALGALIGSSQFQDDPACALPGNQDPDCGWETPAAVIGAAAGVIAGMLFVRYLVPEGWEEIPVASLQVALSRYGIGARVALPAPR